MKSIREDVTDEMIRVRNGMVIVLQDAINRYNKNYYSRNYDVIKSTHTNITDILKNINSMNGYTAKTIETHDTGLFLDGGIVEVYDHDEYYQIKGLGMFEMNLVFDPKVNCYVLDVLAEDLLTNEEYELQYGNPEQFDNMIEQLFIDSYTLVHQ